MRGFLAAFLLVLALDQLSKMFMLEILDLQRVGAIEFLDPYLNFRMAWNRGINFGLLDSQSELARWILTLFAMLVAGFLLHWSRHPSRTLAASVSAGIMAGGATGNAIDRIVHGAVVDFLNMSCCGINNPWVFNIADVAVVLGVAGIALTGCLPPRNS